MNVHERGIKDALKDRRTVITKGGSAEPTGINQAASDNRPSLIQSPHIKPATHSSCLLWLLGGGKIKFIFTTPHQIDKDAMHVLYIGSIRPRLCSWICGVILLEINLSSHLNYHSKYTLANS